MKDAQLSDLTQSHHWFRYWLPYQFVKLESKKHKHLYLPLNRNYKPLGYTKKEWVEYKDFNAQAVVFKSDPQKFKGVWHDAAGLYLYDDGRKSRKDYFERFEVLMARSMPVAELAGKA